MPSKAAAPSNPLMALVLLVLHSVMPMLQFDAKRKASPDPDGIASLVDASRKAAGLVKVGARVGGACAACGCAHTSLCLLQHVEVMCATG
jgi:hypothetical protein